MRNAVTLFCVLVTITAAHAQKFNTYLLKKDGTYVEKQTEADYFRRVYEQDSSKYHPVKEYYMSEVTFC